MKPKILFLDVETSPNTVYCWGLWKQNISIDKIIDSSDVLCFAAKWADESTIRYADQAPDSLGKKVMLRLAWGLLNEADIVVTYNGNSFDLPVLNKEFIQAGFKPPSPYKSVDLCKVVQQQFRFPSSKLDYVCAALGLDTKVAHEGFKLWVMCMEGDKAAWKRMQKYNRQDVRILEQLYERLLPWIKGHPNLNLYTDGEGCPHCSAKKLHKRGYAYTQLGVYQRFQCQACGAWSRGKKALKLVEARPSA